MVYVKYEILQYFIKSNNQANCTCTMTMFNVLSKALTNILLLFC